MKDDKYINKFNTMMEDSDINFINDKSLMKNADNVKPNKYTGVIDISCISTKNIEKLKAELERAFKEENIRFKKESQYEMYCKSGSIEFEVEIMSLELLGYIRLKKLSGDIESYKKIMNKLIKKHYLH